MLVGQFVTTGGVVSRTVTTWVQVATAPLHALVAAQVRV